MDDFNNNNPSSNILKGYRIFLRIIGIIFAAEFMVMSTFWFVNMPSGIYTFVLDSILLSLLSAPFLYFAVTKSVTRSLSEEAMRTQNAREMELKAKAYAKNLAVKAYADNIVKSVQSGLAVVTSDLNLSRVNPYFKKMFSIKAEFIEGIRIDEVLPFSEMKEAIKDTFKNGKTSEVNVVDTSINGNRYFRISISMIDSVDSEEPESQVLLVVEDITERRMSEEKIIQLANYDILTGLPNRRLLMNHLNHALTRVSRHAHYTAVLFIDIDRFKLMNDTFGHSAGDEILTEVSERLKKCVRLSDSVGRLGGDEFLVILPDIEQMEDIIIICNRIYTIFDSPLRIEGSEISVMMSIGISVCPADGEDGDTLLRKADIAMYRAKSDGKSCFRFYSEGMSQSGASRLRLESRLRRASERGELYMNYQPQVDINTGRIYGIEALLRWNDPECGMISPGEFIPIAEESGLIIPIGEWLLRTTCLQAREWQDRGLNKVKVAVNISLRQFMQREFSHTVASILKETGLDAGCLEFELTESIIMDNAETVIGIMNELKQIGVSLAIDDFGTGYSSLMYLKHMPIDIIKIDQSFVRDMTVNKDDAAICDAIIKLAKSLDLEVIAEGVETIGQIEHLRSLNCNNIQGYIVAKPMDCEEAEVLLRKDWLFMPVSSDDTEATVPS